MLNCSILILTLKVSLILLLLLTWVGISADLTLTQLSLNILIISAAGAGGMLCKSVGLGGGELGVSVPCLVPFVSGLLALKLREICF